MSNPVGKSQRKLKNIIINPAYQLRYVFWLTFTGIFLIAMYSLLFYLRMRENYMILVDLSPMTDEAKAQLYMELRNVILQLGLISFGFCLVVGLLGVIYSHRTAGPMYHFKRVFRDIASGRFESRVRLRPKDDFRDVGDAFNEMMDHVCQHLPGRK